jgi:hypothetical protein
LTSFYSFEEFPLDENSQAGFQPSPESTAHRASYSSKRSVGPALAVLALRQGFALLMPGLHTGHLSFCPVRSGDGCAAPARSAATLLLTRKTLGRTMAAGSLAPTLCNLLSVLFFPIGTPCPPDQSIAHGRFCCAQKTGERIYSFAKNKPPF